VDSRRADLPEERSVVLLFASSAPETVLTYFACLAAGHAVALVDPTLKASAAARLMDRYRPDVVAGPVPDGALPESFAAVEDGLARRSGPSERVPPHPHLAVLLTTSGSTGSAKFVRLSQQNIESNADAIIASLGLTRRDSVMTSLPLHYSYGMSLMTSHILAGGSLVLSEASVLEPAFWDQSRRHEVTYFAGVPYTYQMLRRIGFDPASVPSLRAMTQAGGKLADGLVLAFHEAMTSRGGEFFVMYGQTEASPRIACLPSSELPRRVGSAGRALPGGRLEAVDSDGDAVAQGEVGEIAYEGPNVMMGYAEARDDLSLPDALGGRLLTGDLGYLDPDGFLFLTGRLKRIAKVFGTRISLDEVESSLRIHGPVAVVSRRADTLTVLCEWGDDAEHGATRRQLAAELRLPLPALRFERVDALPLLPSGKVDYAALSAEVGSAP
jgi:acyl-CoA synthetase (AMP-forming)/AMP-acid ligase II